MRPWVCSIPSIGKKNYQKVHALEQSAVEMYKLLLWSLINRKSRFFYYVDESRQDGWGKSYSHGGPGMRQTQGESALSVSRCF
jgi:hypothetical protein